MQEDIAHWERIASDWIRWVRTPGHDAFWAYRPAFEALIGAGTGPALEIGAGEGRIARVLGSLGYAVTLVEPVRAFLTAAQDSDSGVRYIQAPAHAIPLPDASMPLVVLYNLLMDVDALAPAMAEAVRLLTPGGRLIIGIIHPLADLLTTHRDTGSWTAGGRYFDDRAFENALVRDGLAMHFRGRARPLSAYTEALIGAGGTLQRLVEPEPAADDPWTQNSPWQGLPLFLWIEASKA
ncbi:MAG: class I SAM-dependent methyltransferase [Pseudomonadota bacterium]